MLKKNLNFWRIIGHKENLHVIQKFHLIKHWRSEDIGIIRNMIRDIYEET